MRPLASDPVSILKMPQAAASGTSLPKGATTSSPALSSTLTQQQEQAVSCRGASVVLSSGAGCGKTHVLTARYLSHLEEDQAEVGQIVAITFTDRAARQMRARIRKALNKALLAADSDEKADRWSRHLRGLETAPIATIHAFCGMLLRQFAVEARLDPHFDVLEEVLAVNLQEEALTSCLLSLLTSATPVGEDLRQLILLYGWKPVGETLRSLLQDYEPGAWDRWLGRITEAVAAQWLDGERAMLLPHYLDFMCAANPKIAHCLNLLRTTPCVGPLMKQNIARLLTEIPLLATGDADLPARIKELKDLAKVGPERGKAWRSDEEYQAIKGALEDFRGEFERRLQLFLETPEDLPDAVAVGQRFLRVAGEAARAYRLAKRRAGKVDFQDLLVFTRDLLRDHPEVREQLRQRYRYLLIDELQDTDRVQMELAELLCGGELEAGKLFAVGDSKQSIYRFRGADVSLFQALRQRMPQEGRLGLTVNFRSQPAILHFANAFLAQRLVDYEPLEPHLPQVNPGPCIEFLWSPKGPKENVNEGRIHEADWIARRIAGMVGGRECLVVDRETGELRPVKQGDVVLLFRAMSNVHLYEQALRNHGLDYYLVGGRAFYAQQEIYDLLNLLRALENPQDGVSLVGTLRSPFCCLSDETLFVMGRHPDGLWAGLNDPGLAARLPADQPEAAERARRFLNRWRGLKDRLPIARLLGEVLADSGFDAAMQLENLGDRKLANLWKLLDLARTFDRSGMFGLAEFIQRLGDLVSTQPREEQAATQPEKADVVRLMSIHQAKGLEFPIVFIADLAALTGGRHFAAAHWDNRLGCVVRPPSDEDPPPFTRFGWQLWQIQEEIEDWHEDLRTLYVACTRAQDYLVLSASLAQLTRPTNAWMLALAERFDLQSGACLDGSIPRERLPMVRVSATEPNWPGSLRSENKSGGLSVRVVPPEAVAAIPVRWQGKPVLPLHALEEYLLTVPGNSRTVDSLLRHVEQALAFDTEDGADRSTWQGPRERMDARAVTRMTMKDRVLCAILEQWDFRKDEEWRSLLPQVLTVAARNGDQESIEKEVEATLAAWTSTDLFRELAKATTCHRNLEFLLDWPPEKKRTPEDVATVLRGLIDCLWQDGQGDWHLLAFAGLHGETPPARRSRSCPPGLVVRALAVREMLGALPKTITSSSFTGPSTMTWTGKQIRPAQVLTTLRSILNDSRGYSPPK